MATLKFKVYDAEGNMLNQSTEKFNYVTGAKNYIETWMRSITGMVIVAMEKSSRNMVQIYKMGSKQAGNTTLKAVYKFEITTK